MARKKTAYISYLSVISAIAVVYLHANIRFWDFEKSSNWIVANIIESIFYFAVPVFFMITGATLLDYNERYGTKTFFKKRAAKTLIPYIVWSIVGIAFSIVFTHEITLADISVTYIVKTFLDGTAVAQLYWFFPMLFCVYLAIPPLAAIPKEKKKTVFTYVAAVCLVLNLIIPFILSAAASDYQFPLFMSIGSGYLFYVIIGYLLKETDLKGGYRAVIYILGLAGLAAQIAGTQILSFEAGHIVETYKGYVNLPAILYSAAVFVLVKSIVERAHRNKNRIWLDGPVFKMSRYTLAIYLMHWYFLEIITAAIRYFMHQDNTWIVYKLVSPIIAIVFSMALTFLLRKIPLIRKIVPD